MTDSSARQEPEYVRCGPCGHIEPEHRPDAGPCLICGCSSYAPESTTPGLTPYRRLLARLEADRAGHLRAAGQTTDEKLRTAGSSYAAALHHAAVSAVAEFEGAEAAREYAQQTSGGEAGAGGEGTADLREQVARAIHRYDNHHALSGNDIPSRHHYGEADAVLAVLPPPADRADWDTLARSTGELRQRTAELRDRAEEVAAKVEQLGDVRAAVLCEAAATYEEILENAPDHAKDPRYWTAIRDVTVGLHRMADEARQTGEGEVEPKPTPMDPVHILGIGSEDQNEAAALRARLLARLTAARANETAKDKVRCTCGGWFPIRHLHADTHQPADEAQQAGEGGALKRAHVALAEQAGRDQAALTRVRALHDNLVASSELTSPDDPITRGAAARRIAAAIDGVTDQPAN